MSHLLIYPYGCAFCMCVHTRKHTKETKRVHHIARGSSLHLRQKCIPPLTALLAQRSSCCTTASRAATHAAICCAIAAVRPAKTWKLTCRSDHPFISSSHGTCTITFSCRRL